MVRICWYPDVDRLTDDKLEAAEAEGCSDRRLIELIASVLADEKAGIQALECKNSTLPAQPDRLEHRELEYIRHGN